jgi:hypothetical protein
MTAERSWAQLLAAVGVGQAVQAQPVQLEIEVPLVEESHALAQLGVADHVREDLEVGGEAFCGLAHVLQLGHEPFQPLTLANVAHA